MPIRFAAVVLGCALSASLASATTITVGPSHDTTLYNSVGYPANGSGEFFFAGNTANNEARRGLLAFDVSAIPSDATVTAVTLTLHMSKTIAGSQQFGLHTVMASWGEGASDAPDDEGKGTTPAVGDATWVRRFHDTVSWATPGGDFAAAASSVSSVGNVGFYNWTGAGLVADVQSWVVDPATNFGWLLMGPETGITAKRFDTRENLNASYRPVLEVQFVPEPASCAAVAALAGLVAVRRRPFTR
jgi:hypothetical protein